MIIEVKLEPLNAEDIMSKSKNKDEAPEEVSNAFEEFEKRFGQKIRGGKVDKKEIKTFIQKNCPTELQEKLEKTIIGFITLVRDSWEEKHGKKKKKKNDVLPPKLDRFVHDLICEVETQEAEEKRRKNKK